MGRKETTQRGYTRSVHAVYVADARLCGNLGVIEQVADLGSRARWATIVAMILADSMILVHQTAAPLAISRTIAALNGSLSISQWVLAANVLPLAAFIVFAGRLGDSP
jgi:hypothetical protein